MLRNVGMTFTWLRIPPIEAVFHGAGRRVTNNIRMDDAAQLQHSLGTETMWIPVPLPNIDLIKNGTTPKGEGGRTERDRRRQSFLAPVD